MSKYNALHTDAVSWYDFLMSIEKQIAGITHVDSIEGEYNLSFEVDDRQEGKEYFTFDHVFVKIDRTGKNIDGYPELSFGTFDEYPDNDSMNQPGRNRDGIDMDYIAACIRRVAEYTRDKAFWIYPFGGDANSEDKLKRQEARFRLFKRYVNLEPGPNNHGYVIRI